MKYSLQSDYKNRNGEANIKLQLLIVGVLISILLFISGYLFLQTTKNAKAANTTFGSPQQVTGVLGQNLPNIILTGSDIANGTQAIFVPSGCENSLTGTIQNTGNAVTWIPTADQTIPNCALTSSQVGSLRVGGVVGEVPTNFSLPQNFAQIRGISTNTDSYVINFATGALSTGNHLHFYYTETDSNYKLQDPNNLPQNQHYSGVSPFNLEISSKPSLARKICVLVANSTHITLENTGNCIDLPITTILAIDNIQTAICNPGTIGQTVSCDFNLANGNYYITPGVYANTGASFEGTNSSTCEIVNNTILQCQNIPTTQAVVGSNNIFLSLKQDFNSTAFSSSQKGTINLTQATPTSNKSGRLYFIGKDGVSANWDSSLEFNTSYLQSQKYKDGKVTLVYDQVQSSNGGAVTTGNCTFKLYRYGNSGTQQNLLKTFTATMTDGKCQTDFTAADQTINYYRVKVEVTSNNSTYYNVDTLVLIVGAVGSSGGTPEIGGI